MRQWKMNNALNIYMCYRFPLNAHVDRSNTEDNMGKLRFDMGNN